MKIVALVSLIALAGVLGAITVCHPEALADNEFLKDFVKAQVLNILALIMTISVASIATIHIWFNELEEKHQQKVFGKARREINHAAFYLIGWFVLQLAVLIVRSMFDDHNKTLVSAFNSVTILIVLCSVVTLLDVMGVVRSLTPQD